MAAKRPPNRVRDYHRSGQHTLERALPYLLERIAGDNVSDGVLTPLEAAARAWRKDAEQDLGGELAATKRALLDAATGSMILLASLDRYVFALAEEGGLVNRRSRRVFPVVESRMRVADGLARQLQALGLEPKATPTPSLGQYLASRRNGQAAAPDPAAAAAPRAEVAP